MRHYLPKVVEKLRSTLVRRREAVTSINKLTLAMPLVYSKTHTLAYPHGRAHIMLTDVYRIRGSRYVLLLRG